MAEEKLIIVEEDALNSTGFLVDDILQLSYETRPSGSGTVQILTLRLVDKTIKLNGADAIATYALIQDSFSALGVDAAPQPIETTQASILAAWEVLDNLGTALSDAAGTTFLRVGTDGVPIELDFAADAFPEYLLADGSRALTADWDAGPHEIRARQLHADIAGGTAPFIVSSGTMVANLNADHVDGFDATAFVWHDLADAADDFLVASGPNVFVKKTLAQTKTILGIGVAHDLEDAWPVGSIYISVLATDPATTFGFGTWEVYGTGRVLVGIDSGDTDFDTVGEQGGAKGHTLTEAEMPAHTHLQNAHGHTQNAHNHSQNAHGHNIANHNHDSFSASRYTLQAAGAANYTFDSGGTLLGIKTGSGGPGSTASVTAINVAATATNQNTTAVNQSTGGGAAHSNLQPYIVVHIWERTF